MRPSFPSAPEAIIADKEWHQNGLELFNELYPSIGTEDQLRQLVALSINTCIDYNDIRELKQLYLTLLRLETSVGLPENIPPIWDAILNLNPEYGFELLAPLAKYDNKNLEPYIMHWVSLLIASQKTNAIIKLYNHLLQKFPTSIPQNVEYTIWIYILSTCSGLGLFNLLLDNKVGAEKLLPALDFWMKSLNSETSIIDTYKHIKNFVPHIKSAKRAFKIIAKDSILALELKNHLHALEEGYPQHSDQDEKRITQFLKSSTACFF